MEQKDILKTSIWKVFEIFVDEPTKIHYVKEISKKINLSPTSVKKHLQNLQEEDFIIKKQGERFMGYMANRDNEGFLFYKKMFNIIKIKKSRLLIQLIKTLYPKTIILYGSYLLGEDIEQSDIDILIISKTKKIINTDKFEKLLKRKIHIIIEKDFNKLQKNLKLEIINGYVLYGYLKNG